LIRGLAYRWSRRHVLAATLLLIAVGFAVAASAGRRPIQPPPLHEEAFARDISSADIQDGGGTLAEHVEAELRYADPSSLVGESISEAQLLFSQRLEAWAASERRAEP
jgi:hypothetical protein